MERQLKSLYQELNAHAKASKSGPVHDSDSTLNRSESTSTSMSDGASAPGPGMVNTLPAANRSEVDEESEGRSGLALVINGHSLVYALSPELEHLFFVVAEHCSCRFKRNFQLVIGFYSRKKAGTYFR